MPALVYENQLISDFFRKKSSKKKIEFEYLPENYQVSFNPLQFP